MRVISGEAKGRRLKTLEGIDVRPTTDRVKEGLFNIIQFDIPCCNFLDLFAGSGQIGIEALSRGAEYALINDQSSKAMEIIKDNLLTTGLIKKCRAVSMEAKALIRSTKKNFDIAFLDPPYNQGILQEVLPHVVTVMNPTGMIICEHEKQEELPTEVDGFKLVKEYKYGKIMLSIYKNPDAENEVDD